jgi:hypothetical protein
MDPVFASEVTTMDIVRDSPQPKAEQSSPPVKPEIEDKVDRVEVGNGLPKLVISYLPEQINTAICKSEHTDWLKKSGLVKLISLKWRAREGQPKELVEFINMFEPEAEQTILDNKVYPLSN